MQTRRERILTYIKEHSSQVSQGFTTAELVVALDLVRSNVSKELNVLVREGLLVKSKGRPVRYQLQGQGKSPKQVVTPKQAEKQVGGQDVAQSDDVLGPYKEPVKATWMDNRIDPHVFKDDDGQLYMYMVRFTDGNTIWGRKMKNPEEFAGEPVCQFASLPDTWETMDNRVAEGPWVIKYRGRYYMMYNANHTATDWGNYQLGVAEADSPLTFQNGGKYSYPVVKSNQVDLEEDYPDILRLHSLDFAYTEQSPEYGWEKTDFDDTDWMRGECFCAMPSESPFRRHPRAVPC